MPDVDLEVQALTDLREALTASSAGHEASVRQHLELQGAPGTAEYAEHRALAFIHQWCFLIEQPPADSAPLRELVGDPVSLRLSDGRELTDFDQIAAWHDATAHAMAVTSHTITAWGLARPENGRYDVSIDFAWQGISLEGQAMTARTHHEWSLTDTGERFPRLSSFVSSLVQPFAPASARDALADLRSVSSQ